ncbi:MAG: leucyl/phenylalanyl-tRNA--protein transferase [Bacteroidales bacterium]|nr:leucyl/phenylalanyl-tRNA--protein transferase [Bacteroidales bacterium]
MPEILWQRKWQKANTDPGPEGFQLDIIYIFIDPFVSYSYLFPDPENADKEGLLAAGGDLSAEALISAYSTGIFPWYNEGSPILWWSPDPRLVLFPENFKVSYTLKQTIKHGKYTVRFDSDFGAVIMNCATVKRNDQEGTWITPEMQLAYTDLYQRGYAHSIETYYGNRLVGGLYGISLGRAFFGESMFHHMSDASKIALYYLVEQLKKWNFHFIDAQQPTTHLKSLGAQEISRKEFLGKLKKALEFPTKVGKWERQV